MAERLQCTKFKWNLKSINALKQSAGVQADIMARAQAIANNATAETMACVKNCRDREHFAVHPSPKSWAGIVHVGTNTWESRKANNTNNVLLNSLDCGR